MPLPRRNIDTGMGLDRMAAILVEVRLVFETSQLRPLVALGEELSGRSWGADPETDRALAIMADHGRATAFLLADGVVPSDEDRGYILRRVMRRAIRQVRAIGIQEPFMVRLCERVIEVMGDVYGELGESADTIRRWVAAEEEGFGHTLEQGERLLGERSLSPSRIPSSPSYTSVFLLKFKHDAGVFRCRLPAPRKDNPCRLDSD